MESLELVEQLGEEQEEAGEVLLLFLVFFYINQEERTKIKVCVCARARDLGLILLSSLCFVVIHIVMCALYAMYVLYYCV